MSKVIKHIAKAKIYNPNKSYSNSIPEVSALFSTNIITDNEITSNGNVKNTSSVNAELARIWVDDNKK